MTNRSAAQPQPGTKRKRHKRSTMTTHHPSPESAVFMSAPVESQQELLQLWESAS
jgi:hypothetical protein